MKISKFLILHIFVLSIFSSAHANTPAVSSEVAAVSQRQEASTADKVFLAAEKLIKQGKYLKARKLYEQLLAEKDLDSSDKQTALSKYESLNYKLVTTKLETPESVFYQVKSGDSLYKIAKKYKTTIALIERSNNLKSSTIHPDQKLKVHEQPFTVFVDKSENVLYLYLAGKLVKRYTVATGKENNTPVGEFKVVDKLKDPTWYKSGEILPPENPDNHLGTRWLGFDKKGYGIHGTVDPDSLGKQASAGCVRMHNKDVEELYDFIPYETVVKIVD